MMGMVLFIFANPVAAREDLARNFVNPPDSCRPWVYAFWLNGNITREGITADLEAMQRVGLGGMTLMEVDQGTPQGPVKFMSQEWRTLFKHLTSEAQRLGLEVNMNNDAGWNGSGGPWVPEDQAMQVVVASETPVTGGKHFEGLLPKPVTNGMFYADIAVLAFPTPSALYGVTNLSAKSVAWTYISGYSTATDRDAQVPAAAMIAKERIVDLTSLMQSDGKLTWTPPDGDWTILRLGHTFSGAKSHPAPASGIGPECDKLSKEALETHFNGMINTLIDDVGPLAGKAFVSTHVDSWEVGAGNWTPKMREEFKRLRGYDMTPFLPVLTGRFVGSVDITERFLWDLRQTASDLLETNYIGHLAKLAHDRGLKLSMEAYGTPALDMDVINQVDEPICEFWWSGGGRLEYSLKAMASAAHVNGRPIVGAEAFTSNRHEKWRGYPGNIKARGDRSFCQGVNRFIIHRYAMQPWTQDVRPGMSMGPYGLHYERTQTWWEQSKAWHQYLTRCQYLLRQGTFVADVLSLHPEEPMQRFNLLTLTGYDYDGISPKAFMEQVAVKEGQLVLPSGMKYRLLVLSDTNTRNMSIAMLRKIRQLVEDGAVILGEAPDATPGLEGYPAADLEIKKMATELWGSGASVAERAVGKGRVFCGMKPEQVLARLGVSEDFTSSQNIQWIHRTVDGADVYFLATCSATPLDVICTFRVEDRQPERWDPVTGTISPLPFYQAKPEGRTTLPLSFGPAGSAFIVFRHKADKATQIVRASKDNSVILDAAKRLSENLPGVAAFDWVNNTITQAGSYEIQTADGKIHKTEIPAVAEPLVLGGPWEVSFDAQGAPRNITFGTLMSWSQHPDPSIKYFSGTGTYRKVFTLSPAAINKQQTIMLLDLGQVEVMAEVKLNNRDLGILWNAPYRVDVTDALQNGENVLEIRVVNLWINRLIGDEGLPDNGDRNPDGSLRTWPVWLQDGKSDPSGRCTFTTWKLWKQGDKLQSSGLIGPVTLRTETRINSKSDDWATAFKSPPDAAKPLTWWHWIDGNVTREGITKDLESMKRAGLGGCYLFSIGGFFREGPVEFMEPSFLGMLDHTMAEAGRLGLKFGVHNCDGWSESGGPWITPETSMKVLTHTAVEVSGGNAIDTVLPMPAHQLDFYREVAVLAFPVPAGKRVNESGAISDLKGSLSADALRLLVDDNPATSAKFPAVQGAPNTFGFVLDTPQTVRSLVFHRVSPFRSETNYLARLEVSADGTDHQVAGTFSINWDTSIGQSLSVAVQPISARYFRLVIENPWPIQIGEIELRTSAKLQYSEGKAGLLRQRGHGGETLTYDGFPGPDRNASTPGEYLLDPAAVLNLTSKMSPDGRLQWDAPPGAWRIMRIGYTSNGTRVHPATAKGTGLECDKLDPKAVRFHLDQYVGKLVQRYGPAVGKTFSAAETDSWECGIQNWSAGLEQRFATAAGYELLPWLPLMLEGWLTGSYDASERMLWDWRRFVADQLIACHFGEVSKYLRAAGLKYVSEGSGRQMYLYDPLGYQRNGDIPMGEFWTGNTPGDGLRVDNKVASSIAHIAGRKFVASESFTSNAQNARWQYHPYTLKALGDSAYCAGVNQFVFHTFAHQPYETIGPGFTMAQWGMMANRKNTWWEPGAVWLNYLGRCNYLLQQGTFRADVLAFIGEDVPNRVGWRADLKPALPEGYDFDACDVTALFEAKVRDGLVVLPSGMEYRVLLMPARSALRPAVLERVRDLARDGAIVLMPTAFRQSPSLRDRGAGDTRVRDLMRELTSGEAKETGIGKGRVFFGVTFEELFAKLALVPDFDSNGASDIRYLHRRIDKTELYFVSNQQATARTIRARFRVSNLQPEIWDPSSGEIRRANVFVTKDNVIEMPLSLDPVGSFFVVFREPAPALHAMEVTPAGADVVANDKGELSLRANVSGEHVVRMSDGTSRTMNAVVAAPVTILGPWQVEFPPDRGAPSRITLQELASWTAHADPGVKYFSGTATYRRDFELATKPQHLRLDLGDVQVMAEVLVNGKNLGVLWKPPFCVEIADTVKQGRNELEVRVTNLWPNRMIGDEQYTDDIKWMEHDLYPAVWPDWLTNGTKRASQRITFATRRTFSKGDALLPSGLLGPVRLIPQIDVPFSESILTTKKEK